jgi:hypothetical protein
MWQLTDFMHPHGVETHSKDYFGFCVHLERIAVFVMTNLAYGLLYSVKQATTGVHGYTMSFVRLPKRWMA